MKRKTKLNSILKEINFLLESNKYLFKHDSPDTAYVIEDYPYGFLRTQMKVWVETHPKKGDRGMSMTLDPKRNRWNKPKAGTYAPIKVMYIDDKGHVQFDAVSPYQGPEAAKEFVKRIGGEEKLNKYQLQKYNELTQQIDYGNITWKAKFEKNRDRIIQLVLRFDVENSIKIRNIIEAIDSLIKTNRKSMQDLYDNDGSVMIFGRQGRAIAGAFKITDIIKQYRTVLKNKLETGNARLV